MPKRDISGVNYASSVTPPGYKCDDCGAVGVKLWREYQTFADGTVLQCAGCAEISQKESHQPGWESSFKRGEGDQIGWRIPAVPVEGENTYWGYTAIPQAGCEWWDDLPAKPGEKISLHERKLRSLTHVTERMHYLRYQDITERIARELSSRLLTLARRIRLAEDEQEFQEVFTELANFNK